MERGPFPFLLVHTAQPSFLAWLPPVSARACSSSRPDQRRYLVLPAFFRAGEGVGPDEAPAWGPFAGVFGLPGGGWEGGGGAVS